MLEKEGNVSTINTAEFNDTPRVALEQPTGDVTIAGWDRPAIEIRTDDENDDYDVEIQGSQVTVRNRPRKVRLNEVFEPAIREIEHWGLDVDRVASKVERSVERGMRKLRRGFNVNIDFGSFSGGHDFKIMVPHNCDLMLRTSTGDLYIKDVNGTLFTHSTSGDVHMDRISGNVLANSASGDINIRDLEGKVGVRTASGDVLIERADVTELGAQTASGDITMDLRRVPEREFEVRTVSGDLRVTLPTEARLTAEMHTVSGDLRCKLPYELIQRSGRRSQSLLVNGGGPAARFQSISGDVSIVPDRRGEGGARTSDLSRVEGAEGQEEDIREPERHVSREQAELDILQALEKGEITSQEAMRRLSRLGR